MLGTFNSLPHHLAIYTDGSGNWKTGIGGYGFICLKDNISNKVDYQEFGSFCMTTVPRMELLAMIRALKYLKTLTDIFPIKIYSDSEYVVNVINQNWAERWRLTDFYGIKNKELISEYLKLYDELVLTRFLEIYHIRGHSGVIGNELADSLARKGYSASSHIVDNPENIIKYINETPYETK